MSTKTIAVIPARYGSSRLPGKPLIPIAGVPLVIRVLRAVERCSSVDRVIVATDDQRIAEAVQGSGGEVEMTPTELATGGDRVAWVARKLDASIVLNVQGDDPLVGPDMIDPLVRALKEDPSLSLAVCVKAIEDPREVEDSHIVKVVMDQRRQALYFSRSSIPYPRERGHCRWYKHIGPYCWRRDFLLQFAQWDQSPLERSESLEMLRVLERGHPIQCVEVQRDTIEIDTPHDLDRLEAFLARHGDRP